MQQLDRVVRGSKKSFSQTKDIPRHDSPDKPLFLGDLLVNSRLDRQGLERSNRELRKPTIKINMKKLPAGFFSSQAPELLGRLNFDKRETRGGVQQKYPNIQQKDNNHNIEDELPHYEYEPLSARRAEPTDAVWKPVGLNPDHLSSQREQLSPSRKQRRNYLTRSEEKRQKIAVDQRKFTAGGNPTRPDSLDLFPFNRPQSEFPDMIVFNGTFARDSRQNGGLHHVGPRTERQSQLTGLRFDSMTLKTDRKIADFPNALTKDPEILLRQLGSPGRKNFNSPTKREKESISPVKIIVTNNEPRQTEGTPMSNSAPITSQLFDMTFYNTKSSALPPISK